MRAIRPAAIAALIIAMVCCTTADRTEPPQGERLLTLRKHIGGIADEESLGTLMQFYRQAGDRTAIMLCCRRLGQVQREKARFAEAIMSHREALELAIELNDTVEIVQALNNLGTDFRRIGALVEASDHHHRALDCAEAYSRRSSPEGRKNRVVAMNGIGNVNLTLGYNDQARRFFQTALKEETALKSHIGQAINLANLGAICEDEGKLDSAEIFYRRSMEHNRLGKSDLGMGLCHTHLGHLYRKQQRYDLALKHYTEAYRLMNRLSDRWHWLEACLAMAEIHLITRRYALFLDYVGRAEQTAGEIASPEHLADVHRLRHDYHLASGNPAQALRHYKESRMFEDSVKGVEKAGRYLDIRMKVEKENRERTIAAIRESSEAERRSGRIIIALTVVVLIIVLMMTGMLVYLYRQRIRNVKALAEMEKMRTEFFTGITHDFRTPITIIQANSGELREPDDIDPRRRIELAGGIDRQARMLLAFVNQLLDIARLRSAKQDPRSIRADIGTYIRMNVECHIPYAQRKRINLQLTDELGRCIFCFIPTYIDKIMANLLANAIKYTPEEGRIDVLLAPLPKGGIILKVTDNGCGIAAEDLPRIFDLFYRSKKVETDIGTGVGLSFTRLLVGRMGGTINAESHEGEGTTITVRFPRRQCHGTPEAGDAELRSPETDDTLLQAAVEAGLIDAPAGIQPLTAPDAEDGNEEKPLILVAEDNADVRNHLARLLEPAYRVVMASDGEQALALCREHLPDLVVTDVSMPRKDGFELCRELKTDIATGHIPVAMVTARVLQEDRLAGLDCGADFYLNKPFDPRELRLMLHNIFRTRRILKALYTRLVYPEPLPAPTTPEAPEAERTEAPDHTAIDSQTDLDFVHRVIDFIDTHLNDNRLSVEAVAEAVCLSPSQLNRKLKVVLGGSTLTHIQQRRAICARKLLDDRSLTVTQVAADCGYADTAHLSRAFRRVFGMSPTEYREKKQQNA